MADEFIASRRSSGVSDAYVRSARHNLKKFTDRLKGNVTDIAVGDLFGSTMANMLILAVVDLLPPRRPGERGDPCYLRFREATGRMVGVKPAGGIRTSKDAIKYLVTVNEVAGARGRSLAERLDRHSRRLLGRYL